MRISLDTNRYTDFQRGDADARRILEDAEAVFLPFAAVAELRVGFAGGRRGAENEKLLEAFLARPGMSIIYADEATTRQYALLYHQLRRQGTPIPTNDIWIAAVTLQHSLTLYSRDAHFDHLSQLLRI